MARKALGSAPSDPKDTATKGYVDTEDTASRDRTNHTGTQTASTISDFQSSVSGNSAVTANTAKVSYTDAAKVAGIEAGADVTDTTNVSAAGALMDSEVTNLTQVKAFDTTDYATAAQGTTADSAIQPADISDFETTTELNARDTANRSRTNHTGTQTMSTISDAGSLATKDSADSEDLTNTIGCQASLSSNQLISNATIETIEFDNEDFDSGGNFNTSTGEFTCPEPGKYLLSGHITLNNLGSGDVQYMYLLKNGGIQFRTVDYCHTSNLELTSSLAHIFDCAASDTLSIGVYHNYGSVRNCLNGSFSGISVAFLGT